MSYEARQDRKFGIPSFSRSKRRPYGRLPYEVGTRVAVKDDQFKREYQVLDSRVAYPNGNVSFEYLLLYVESVEVRTYHPGPNRPKAERKRFKNWVNEKDIILI